MTLGQRLWEPTSARRLASNMQRFSKKAELASGQTFADYRDLHRWSVEYGPEFWALLQRFVGIEWLKQPDSTWIAPPAGAMRGATWFPGGQLNYSQNLLANLTEGAVVTSVVEGQGTHAFSAQQLRDAVARCAAALRRSGVVSGDRVAAVTGNTAEALIGMLATTSIGAIWSSCSPDFGAKAITDRFAQLSPKILFATQSYWYGGKPYDVVKTIESVVTTISGLERIVAIGYPLQGQAITQSLPWEQFLDESGFSASSPEPLPIDFAPLPFGHPLFIMFSSGTTGAPKCIVHSHGGTLLQHKKELSLHCDLKPTDTLCYFTTCGWMMWNWMASALSVGARLMLFEGSPSYPDLGVLWKAAAEHGVSHLGISPKFLASCMQAKIRPAELLGTRPASLRTLLSTGSPLLPEHFEWVYREVASDLHLASISGGTDIISCFVLGNPAAPVYSGEIQGPGLGMAVAAWNEEGVPVTAVKGELVCTKPFVSMPIGFWNDPDGRRYRDAYFRQFDGKEVWYHGDFIEFCHNGGAVIYGRSDATLNPGGVRIGTAEIYRVVENIPGVVDSVAVEWNCGAEGSIALFVKLAAGCAWSEGLAREIRNTIKADLSPRHAPRILRQVQDIPYTRSGKKVELAVGHAINFGVIALGSEQSLANPESLEEYAIIGQSLASGEP